MICKGTLYDEWLEEKPWLPLHNIVSVIYISLHLILLFIIKISEKNFNKPAEKKYHHQKGINFGTNFLSWVIYGLLFSGFVGLAKFNRYINNPICVKLNIWLEIASFLNNSKSNIAWTLGIFCLIQTTYGSIGNNWFFLHVGLHCWALPILVKIDIFELLWNDW